MESVPPARASAYQLAFDEAGRALDAQERTVNELRSRAGVLIAAAAIATSFFGSRAITDEELGPWVWAAVAAFVVVGACVLLALWPLIADYVEPETVELPLIHRDLALHRAAAYDRNALQLGRLFMIFRGALLLLVVEVAAWIAALAEGT